MVDVVVDSNVIVASFLEWEDFHQRGSNYIAGLENGDYTFHLPMVVVVEVMSAIGRRARRNRQALLRTWQQNVADWERDGRIILYPLDRDRMNHAADTAARLRLSGQDSVVASLSEELAMTLISFDREILARYLGSSV